MKEVLGNGKSVVVVFLMTLLKKKKKRLFAPRKHEDDSNTRWIRDMPGLLGNDLLRREDLVSGTLSFGSGLEGERELVNDGLWAILGCKTTRLCDDGEGGVGHRLLHLGLSYSTCVSLIGQWAWSGSSSSSPSSSSHGGSLCLLGLADGAEEVLEEYRKSVLALHSDPNVRLARLLQMTSWWSSSLITPLQHALMEIQKLVQKHLDEDSAFGRVLLDHLYDQWYQYDQLRLPQRIMWRTLLHSAASPYFLQLSRWCAGYEDLTDPYSELFVYDRGANVAWADRFGLKQDDSLPKVVSLEQAQMILAAGKYAHLMRQMRLTDDKALVARLLDQSVSDEEWLTLKNKDDPIIPDWTPESSRQWHEHIQMLASRKGTEVLRLLREDGRLMEALNAIQTMCLLHPNSWIPSLMEVCPMDSGALDCTVLQLQTWVEVAVGQGVARMARASLATETLAQERSRFVSPSGQWKANPASSSSSSSDMGTGGVNATIGAMLRVSCDPSVWPLPLLIPAPAMHAYSLCFRRLLQYSLLSHRVRYCIISLSHMHSNPTLHHSIVAAITAGRLAERSLQCLLRFFSWHCHQPSWNQLMSSVSDASSSLEHLTQCCVSHLKVCLTGLMLSVPSSIADALDVLLDTCDAYVLYVNRILSVPPPDMARVVVEKNVSSNSLALKDVLINSVSTLTHQLVASKDHFWDLLIEDFQSESK